MLRWVCTGHVLHCCNPVALAASFLQSPCGRLVVPLLIGWLPIAVALQLCPETNFPYVYKHKPKSTSYVCTPNIYPRTHIPNVVSQFCACLALQQLADIDSLVCTTILSCISTADCTLAIPGQQPSLPWHKAEMLGRNADSSSRLGWYPCMRGVTKIDGS